MKSNKLKYTLTSAALFAAATAAAQSVATENIWSVENQTDYTVGSGEYVKASGYYYKDASGVFHRGPVVNVGTFNLNGIFESNYSASAPSLFGAGTVLGSGELRVGAGIFVSPTTDMSGFNGKISVFADNETRKPAIYFVSSTNNPANASFDITQNGAVSFTNGDYTLNGKIAGAGTLKAEKLSNITLADGTEVVKNSEPAKVVVKGDISEFSGGYAASGNSTIKLETTLADSVKFSGSQGGSLELVGGAGDAKKTVTVSSGTNTTTSGNVYMYGNKAVIAQNSNDAGTLDANGGTIYFGGKNGYSAAEKVSHTFDTTTVTGNTAGNVVVGGKGTGASMEAGADIVVDGVKIDSLVAGGAEGASVNGDINVTVKSGTVASLAGGKGGIHTGNTNITVENGSVANIYGGDQHGGQINGDISVNVKDGTVGTIYGANYVSTSEKASDFNGVNGNVKIDVNGGTVNHIRGGINSTNAGDAATAKSKMVLNGNVEVNVSGNAHIGADDGESILATGGSYGSVNGNTTINISDNAVVEGIVAGGASRTDDKGVKSTYINVKGGTLNGDIYGGGLKYSTVTENTNVNISGGTVNANVYGGGATNTTVKGNSNITVSGTAVVNGTLNGGGLNGGTVEGTKTLNIGTAEASYESETALKVADFDKINVQGNSDAKIENITQNLTGAVQDSRTIVADGSKLTVTGNIENTLTDATNSGSFVAGVTGGDAVVNGTVKTVIDGEGTSLHYVYGGNGGNQKVVDGKTSPKGVSKVGAVDLTVNNGKIDMIVASGAMYSDVDGDVNVKVNGGNVGSIFGVGSTNSVGGDVNISVKNATVGHITAAGSGINQATPSVVNGSTNITIGENAVVTEDIYGGGWGDGKSWPTVVKGDSTVTLTSNASVQGTIHGGGWNGQYDIVEGTKTLNIGTADEAYSNASALKVADFDKINVQGGSVATVNGNMSNVVVRKENTKTEILTGALVNVDSTSTAKFEDSNFNDNSVSVYVENPYQNYAAIVEGGIVNVNNVSEFKNSNFKGNVIKSEANVAVAGSNVKGGIINASANSTIKIEGSAFEQNTINAKSNSSYATVYGGILNVNDGATADLVTTKFIGNNVSTTDSYGPVYGGIIRSLGDTTITSVTMDGNTLNTSGKASSFFGALISVANGTTTVSDSDFNNTIMEATKDSSMINGVIYVGGEPGVASSAQVLNVSNSTFSGNKATSSYGVNGSALYVTGETATANISNSIFENNTAVAGSYKARGGAVANYHGIMTLTDVSFKGNSAESSTVDYAQGGALYARNYNSGARTVLNDVSFNDNTAKNGMGGAVYVEGSEIEFNVSKDATISGNMASDSDGNMSDSRGGFIYMKNYDGSKASSANFNIFENVKMTIGDGSLNKDSIASSDNTAVINKSGAGSLVVNGSMEYFTGALNVNNGYMEVNNGLGASTVNVASSAKFSLILKSNSLANTDYVNAGTIMLHRGALIDGDSVTMKSYNGEGVVSAFGGSFANGKFTAGASAEIAEQAVTVGPNESDVVTVTKSVTGGGQLSLNFDVSKMSESITITAVNDVKEAAMQSGAISGEVLSAFDVEAQNQQGDFSVVLSSKVGEGLDAAKILAWHSDDSGATWTRLEDAEISYDGLFASMVVEGFSAYAFSVVPEPSTYAAIAGVIALALAAWRRRK